MPLRSAAAEGSPLERGVGRSVTVLDVVGEHFCYVSSCAPFVRERGFCTQRFQDCVEGVGLDAMSANQLEFLGMTYRAMNKLE